MQRSHVIKAVVILALVVLAVVSLLPTFQLNDLQEKESNLVKGIASFTGLSRSDINAAVNQGELESLVRKVSSADSQEKALSLSAELITLNTEITQTEGRAIRQGLDLQGGTYLVYEADLPQLLRDVAKNKDDRLEDIIEATKKKTEKGQDFFEALESTFNERNVGMSRYFGRKGKSNEEIIKELGDAADDAVNRTLEVLRNRIDQFGVSEPSIQKQGNRRIIIQLAGIQNIQRAKKIIGTTAKLEFKLVKDAQLASVVLEDINRVLRKKRKGEEIKESSEAVKDSVKIEDGDKAEETEVSLTDLFGEQEESEAGADTTLLVDEKTFSERPFTSLLRRINAYSDAISVPSKNARAVQRILQMPEVIAVIPGDAEFVWSRKPLYMGEEEFQQIYLVKKEPELLGSTLTDANVDFGASNTSLRGNESRVLFSLNSEGSKQFAKVTGMNIGKKLAIVLDNKVASAPNITGKIPTGSAEITGSFTVDEAKDLALVLRAGALPAPVHVITENTVGPSLGHDSIQKGQQSAIIGLLLVILFMIFYYRGSGAIADFALLLNIVFVLAIMASFHATLTLPGIAGIILTVGMAVDANVLIFERIREEIKAGKTIRAAIDSGYGRAFTTILDANITTLITAVVLYSFGTGPIKGFALTLSIGIIASMFTAIVVTRLIFDMITSRYAIKKLSI